MVGNFGVAVPVTVLEESEDLEELEGSEELEELEEMEVMGMKEQKSAGARSTSHELASYVSNLQSSIPIQRGITNPQLQRLILEDSNPILPSPPSTPNPRPPAQLRASGGSTGSLEDEHDSSFQIWNRFGPCLFLGFAGRAMGDMDQVDQDVKSASQSLFDCSRKTGMQNELVVVERPFLDMMIHTGDGVGALDLKKYGGRQ